MCGLILIKYIYNCGFYETILFLQHCFGGVQFAWVVNFIIIPFCKNKNLGHTRDYRQGWLGEVRRWTDSQRSTITETQIKLFWGVSQNITTILVYLHSQEIDIPVWNTTRETDRYMTGYEIRQLQNSKYCFVQNDLVYQGHRSLEYTYSSFNSKRQAAVKSKADHFWSHIRACTKLYLVLLLLVNYMQLVTHK